MDGDYAIFRSENVRDESDRAGNDISFCASSLCPITLVALSFQVREKREKRVILLMNPSQYTDCLFNVVFTF